MKSLRGKKCLVTGAASGIGRAIALELCRKGAHVYLLDIDQEKLQQVVQQCAALQDGSVGPGVIGKVCDLADPAQISAAIADMLQTWNGLDVLINNAGVVYCGPTHNMTAQQWDWVMGINLAAPIQLIRQLLPALLEREEAHILNVCSIGGLVSRRDTAAYNASKFGLVGLSESLRQEYWRRGLGVTALCPGFVKTDLLKRGISGHPRKPMPQPPPWACTTPEHVAAVGIDAIMRNRGVVLITPLAHLVWAMKRLSPGFFDYLMREGWRKKKRRRPAPAPATPAAITAPLESR
jgi:3-oxoacyl-[acyl-carrier protein] reductase